jgi:hypothetical protein
MRPHERECREELQRITSFHGTATSLLGGMVLEG